MMILTSIYIIALKDVSSLITILSSSSIRLLVLYNSYDDNDRDGLELDTTKITKTITLPIVGPDTYSLPV